MPARSLTVSMRAYVFTDPRAPSVVVRDRSTRTRRVRTEHIIGGRPCLDCVKDALLGRIEFSPISQGHGGNHSTAYRHFDCPAVAAPGEDCAHWLWL
jgi:hypothetical protein